MGRLVDRARDRQVEVEHGLEGARACSNGINHSFSKPSVNEKMRLAIGREVIYYHIAQEGRDSASGPSALTFSNPASKYSIQRRL